MPQWFIWTVLAQRQLRAIDRVNAKRILDAIDQLRFGQGDIENMVGYDRPTKRLRVGKYRVIYRELPENRFNIRRVAARGGVYRD
jgi:mRNA-degrading endonuclease RelE of RelBE toxin-antitoxin system